MSAYKLDLNKALLALDTRDKNFYNKLSDEEKKGFQPLILMKYLSSVPNGETLPYLALVSINELVNVDFWELSSEPEMQAKLLALCGIGKKTYHKWIPFNNRKTSVLENFIKEIFQQENWFINSTEIDIFLMDKTEQDIKDLCHDFGKDKETEKKIVAEFRKL